MHSSDFPVNTRQIEFVLSSYTYILTYKLGVYENPSYLRKLLTFCILK